ncbi:MAG: RNA methyltransferase, partial [Phenylobacterium sp.]|uniref:class I SAM-dependent RNA methyltransferase n=1 Tax=Phenylobacterium sp. TaxID=1871053 RepID=UPI002733FF79
MRGSGPLAADPSIERGASQILTDIRIQAVGGEGDGIAEGPIYAPFTLAGERVRVAGTGERRELVEVLEPSAQRIQPPCPHFGACGGCALQHWEHSAYLTWKVDRLVATLARERIETEFLKPFAAPPGSRRRLTLHARQGRRGEARLGYKARKSWSLVDIEVCTIADPRLVAAIPALRRLAAPLFQHAKSAPSLHLTWSDAGLDVDISGVERRSGGGLSADARMRLADQAAAADFARVTLDGEAAYMSRQPTVRVGPANVALPAGAFLQAVSEAEAALAAFAVDAVQGASRIADLYCGVGAFSFRLAQVAPVLAVDSSAPAVRALSGAIASAPGLKGITAQTRDLVRRPVLAEELKKIDAVVFDPP